MKSPVVVLMIGDRNELVSDIAKRAASSSNGAVSSSSYFLDVMGNRTDMSLDPVMLTNVLCVDRAKDYLGKSKAQQFALPLYDETSVILAPVSAIYASSVYEALVDYPRVDLRVMYIAEDSTAVEQRRKQFLDKSMMVDTFFTSHVGKGDRSAEMVLEQVSAWNKNKNELTGGVSNKPMSTLAKRALKVGSDAIHTIKTWQRTSREMKDDSVEILIEAFHETHGDISKLSAKEQHGLLLAIYASGGISLKEFEQANASQLPLEDLFDGSEMQRHLDVAEYAYNAELEAMKPHTIEDHMELMKTHTGFFDYMEYNIPLTVRHSNIIGVQDSVHIPANELEDVNTNQSRLNL